MSDTQSEEDTVGAEFERIGVECIANPSSSARKKTVKRLGELQAIEEIVIGWTDVSNAIVLSTKDIYNTVEDIQERSFNEVNQWRRDAKYWIEFPGQIMEHVESLESLKLDIEGLLLFMFELLVIVVCVLIARNIIESILDTVDIGFYCHKEGNDEDM